VQKEKRVCMMNLAHKQYEAAKQRVFASAISAIMDDGEHIKAEHHICISFLLASFPDREKMNDGRSWLPLHFAIALGKTGCSYSPFTGPTSNAEVP
jgi:hypothetical protein